MKKIILLLILISPVVIFSQNKKKEFLNFKLLKDKTLIWQKVFETEKSLNDLQKYFLLNDFTSNLKFNDSVLSGRSGKAKLSSFKGAPMAAYQSFDVFIRIQYKNGKYRITVSNLQFEPTSLIVTSGGVGVGQSRTYSLEDLAVRNNHFEIRKNSNIRNMLNTFNEDFIKLFTIKNEIEEDW